MRHYIVLGCAVAALSCTRLLSRADPTSPDLPAVRGAVVVGESKSGPSELHMIDFFSRRPRAGAPSDASARMRQRATGGEAHPDSARKQQDDALIEARALAADESEDEALLMLRGLIAENDEFMEAYLERAKIYLNKNMYEAAARDFREAISCDADNMEAHYELGITCEKWAEKLEASGDAARAFEKFREAIVEYKKTLWLSRGYPPAYYGLGCAYARLGMREDARYYFKRAIGSAKPGSDLARRARYNVQLLGGY
jgi:tetratricopeptide (TPR) repeat protein